MKAERRQQSRNVGKVRATGHAPAHARTKGRQEDVDPKHGGNRVCVSEAKAGVTAKAEAEEAAAALAKENAAAVAALKADLAASAAANEALTTDLAASTAANEALQARKPVKSSGCAIQ